MKDCKNCTEKEALSQFAIEKANDCAKLKAELAKAKDAICEAVYRSNGKNCADGEKDGRLFFWKGRAEQLADQLRKKDMELLQTYATIWERENTINQKDAEIFSLRGRLDYLFVGNIEPYRPEKEQVEELCELSDVNSMLRKVSSEKDELIDTLKKENGKLQTRCAALENLNKGYEAVITEQDKKIERFSQECKDLQESGRRLAEEIREKDHELAQKDAKFRELEGILCYKPIHGADDLVDAASRFFEALFSYADGNENGGDA